MVFYPVDFEGNVDDARFVNPKVFVEWLHDEFGEEELQNLVSVQGDSITRRWFRWREESQNSVLNVYAVDEFLLRVFQGEIMLHDLPPHAFSFRKTRLNPKGSLGMGEKLRKIKVRTARRALNGEDIKDLAAELQRTPGCISKWKTEYERGELKAA